MTQAFDNPSATPPDRRVPFGTKLAAGSGEAAINVGVNLPKNFAFPIYNIALGVSPTLLGIAMLVPRFWDALIDPVMGNISDNTRGRWGRRKPYMLVGAVLSAACVIFMCVFPRGMKQGAWGETIRTVLGYEFTNGDLFYAGWLMATSIIFYTCLTIFAVPYGALTMELTGDYEERTRVMSFRTFFTYVSGLLIGWLYAIAEWDIFKGADGKPDVIKGTYAVGLLLAAVMIVVMLAPTLFVREPVRKVRATPRRADKEPDGGGAAGTEATSATEVEGRGDKTGFWRGLGETLREPAFLLIIAAYTVGFLGVIMVIGLGQYVNYYYVYGGDTGTGSIVQGWAHTLAVLCGIVAVVVINRLAKRFEKKTLLIAALSCSFVGGLLSWVLYNPNLPTINLIGWLPGGHRWPFHPLSFSYALIWPGLAGLLIMSNSMIADVCDIDELKTGQRREGMYWAVFNWIQKTAISIALLFSGVILDAVGFDAKLPHQTPGAIFHMRLAYLLVVCGGAAAAIVLTAMIPLNRQRLDEVHRRLAEQRGE